MKKINFLYIACIVLAVMTVSSCSVMGIRFGDISDVMAANKTNGGMATDFGFEISFADGTMTVSWKPRSDGASNYASSYTVFESTTGPHDGFIEKSTITASASTYTRPEYELTLADLSTPRWIRVRCAVSGVEYASTAFLLNAAD